MSKTSRRAQRMRTMLKRRESKQKIAQEDRAWGPNPYFGESWSVPATDDAPWAATPVGEPCSRCEVPVADGDRGFLIPNGSTGALEPMHRECMLQSTSGHIFGYCDCSRPGKAPLPPAERRARALALWDHVQKMGPKAWE